MVLGCGPAGLFAAHAARQMGFGVDIFSKKRRSEMFGAQYLHTQIPGLTDDQQPFTVEYRLNGSLDDYLHKVYGKTIPDPGKITRESLLGKYEAWDIRRAYLRAWDLFGRDVCDVERINNGWLHGVLGKASPWDVVVSTIPMPDICVNPEHHFEVRQIWAMGDAPERGQFVPRDLSKFATDNIIQYDGTPENAWYRISNIAGYCAAEWPQDRSFDGPYPGRARVDKPVKTNCDCWDSFERSKNVKVVRVGRYGAWHRTGHTHQAYWRVLAALGDLL
jgi:hypothetical protein